MERIDSIELGTIAKKSFDSAKRRGPRRDHIYSRLNEYGLHPRTDDFGNLWVQKGVEGSITLYSSHMDIDANTEAQVRTDPKSSFHIDSPYERDPSKVDFVGVLDNAVGCYMNMYLARFAATRHRTLHVFTVSEEENPQNPDLWGIAAFVGNLRNRSIEPGLAVSIDVTYPRLLVPSVDLENLWDTHLAEELFDETDAIRCYVNGISRQDAARIATDAVAGYASDAVAVRHLTGFDEAYRYSEIAPAFSVGPVFFGKPDEPGQRMPKRNAETALDFLLFLAGKH